MEKIVLIKVQGGSPMVIQEKDVEKWLNDGSLKEGDELFYCTITHKTRVTKTLHLTDDNTLKLK